MTPKQEQELIDFVCASKKDHRISFLELSMTLFHSVFEEAVSKDAYTGIYLGVELHVGNHLFQNKFTE